MSEREIRYLPMADARVHVEERANGMPPVIRGISPPWNSRSVDLGGFREIFAPTAFDHLLDRPVGDAGPDVLGLFNHDENMVLARTTSGTLRLSKTPEGLEYTMELPDTQLARDLAVLLRRGDVSGASFAFSCRSGGEAWSKDTDGTMVRTISSADLYDVSVVTRPAYPKSTAAMRSLEEWQRQHGDARPDADKSAKDAAAAALRRMQAEASAAIALAKAKMNGL